MDKIFKKFKFKISIKRFSVFSLAFLYAIVVFFLNFNYLFEIFLRFLVSQSLYFYLGTLLFFFSLKYIIDFFKYGNLQDEFMKSASNSLETELYKSISSRKLNDSYTFNFLVNKIVFTNSYLDQFPLEYNYFPDKFNSQYKLFLRAILPLVELRTIILESPSYYNPDMLNNYFYKIKEFKVAIEGQDFSKEFLYLLHRDLPKIFKELKLEINKYDNHFSQNIDFKNIHLLSLVQNEKINDCLKFFFLNYRELKRFKREENV